VVKLLATNRKGNGLDTQTLIQTLAETGILKDRNQLVGGALRIHSFDTIMAAIPILVWQKNARMP